MLAPTLLCACLGLAAAKDYFTASVFEHRPAYSSAVQMEPDAVKAKNLEYFEKAARLAAEKGTDIILFNEYGTFVYQMTRERMKAFAEHVPDPQKHAFNPCEEGAADRPVLHRMSCLAREHRMYVAFNLVDVQPCEGSCDADGVGCGDPSPCPADGCRLYNTDVVFDRQGSVVARYHKVHPYFEVVNVPEGPEMVTFRTDFGTFGAIVCFDLVFEEAVRLVRERGVDTLLFPTYWFDDIVPLTAVEFQQAFAVAHGINLMAANAHAPGTGTLGSGIYSAGGALVYTYEPDGRSKLLVANVALRPGAEVPDVTSSHVITEEAVLPHAETGEHFPQQCYNPGQQVDELQEDGGGGRYRCFKLKVENYTLARLEGPSGQVESCSDGFCCRLTYKAKDMREDFFLAAFNGLNNVRGYFKYWEEACVLTRCDPLGGRDCVLQPSTSNTVFEEATLEAEFKSKAIYPGVSKTRLRLSPKREWNFEQMDDGKARLEFVAQSDDPLLRVTLLGRDYERDEPFVPFCKF